MDIYRRLFICSWITHLFQTSFEDDDYLTVPTVLTSLNASLPPGKYVDFDEEEVATAIGAGQRKGFVLEGDIIRKLRTVV